MAKEVGVVSELWRYPVMGLRGERIKEADILEQGVAGDRIYVLSSVETGKVVDPVKYGYSWGETDKLPSLLDLIAEFNSQSTSRSPSVNISTPGGNVVSSDDPEFDAVLSETLHTRLKLMEYPRVAEARVKSGRALHLLTNSSLRSMKSIYAEGDFDVRRFRPNVMIETELDGFPEEDWIGTTMALGREVELKVEKPNKRCKLTTMKQGELMEDKKIQETISLKHDNTLGVMCSVLKVGKTRLGDSVRLLSQPRKVF